jgi:hypothetical protein
MGIEAFAERARCELQATAETARKRTIETSEELTAQEAVIARLAARGCRTRRSAAGCPSAPARFSTIWARSSPSSPSARAASSTGLLPSDPAETRPT